MPMILPRPLLLFFVLIVGLAACRRDVEPSESGGHLEQPALPSEGVTSAEAEDAAAQAREVVTQFLDYDFRGARLRTDHPLKPGLDQLLANTEGGSETIWVVDSYRVEAVRPVENGYAVTVSFPHAVLMAGDFAPLEERTEMREQVIVRDRKIVEEGGIAHVGLDTVVEHIRRVASAEDAEQVRAQVDARFKQ